MLINSGIYIFSYFKGYGMLLPGIWDTGTPRPLTIIYVGSRWPLICFTHTCSFEIICFVFSFLMTTLLHVL